MVPDTRPLACSTPGSALTRSIKSSGTRSPCARTWSCASPASTFIVSRRLASAEPLTAWIATTSAAPTATAVARMAVCPRRRDISDTASRTIRRTACSRCDARRWRANCVTTVGRAPASEVLRDPTVHDRDATLAVGGDTCVVRDEDDRLPAEDVRFPDELEDGLARTRIQVAG